MLRRLWQERFLPENGMVKEGGGRHNNRANQRNWRGGGESVPLTHLTLSILFEGHSCKQSVKSVVSLPILVLSVI